MDEKARLESFLPIRNSAGDLIMGWYHNVKTRNMELYKMEKANMDDLQEYARTHVPGVEKK